MLHFDKVEVAKHFSRAASSYGEHNHLQRDTAAQLMALITQPSNGCRVIDIGCGPGVMTQALVEHLHTDHYQGVDLALGMLEFARAKFPHYDFRQGDAENLTITDNTADVVVSNLMMQWLNNPAQALSELLRITGPGGQIVLSTVLNGSLSEFQQCWHGLGLRQAVNSFATVSQWQSLLATVKLNHQVKRVKFFSKNYRYSYGHVRDLFAHLKGIGANYHPSSSGGRALRRTDIDAINHCMTDQFGVISGDWHIGFIAIEIEK